MNENNVLNKSVINWYPGHMAKTRRLIKEKYDLIDIVYELIDARIPYSSKIKDIYDLIGNKPKIIIMTKKDLCDLKVTNYWVKYYENLGFKVLLLDLNDNNDYKKIIDLTLELTEDIREKRAKKLLGSKEIRALVIGIPNVGKSTLINKLANKKVANVGNNPGITQNISWLKTPYNITLLDTPGILWPKLGEEKVALNLAAVSSIKMEILPIEDVAIHILKTLKEYYPDILKERYNLTNLNDFTEVYEILGAKLGAMKKGEPDYDRINNTIINDIKQEKIKGVTFDRK